MYLYMHKCIYTRIHAFQILWKGRKVTLRKCVLLKRKGFATMKIRIHTSISLYTNVYIFKILYMYTYIHMHTYIRIHTYIHIYTCMHIYTYIRIHIYIHVCIYIHIYVYTYIYMYAYIYIYTYTHIYMSLSCIHKKKIYVKIQTYNNSFMIPIRRMLLKQKD